MNETLSGISEASAVTLGAARIAEHLDVESRHKAYVAIGLCGGRSPYNLYRELSVQIGLLSKQQRSRLHFFQVDERLFEELNAPLIAESLTDLLLEKGLIESTQVHFYPTQGATSENAYNTEVYYAQLQEVGEIFSVCILGVGEDGHIAAAFPNHTSSLQSNPSGFLSYEQSPKLPHWRVTATVALLKKSSLGVLLFFGQNKREAYARFVGISVSANADIEVFPALVINSMKNKLIIVDDGAFVR